jgi:amidophosphoribosyltransferase
MGGIVGLLTKSPAFRQQLGRHVAAMLAELSEHGPDSAGLAVYCKPAATR